MPIPLTHPRLVIDGVRYDLAHLNAFAAGIPDKGATEGEMLGVVVAFSNHVYTERTKYGDRHDTHDHNGTKRSFDPGRHEVSKLLPALLKNAIETDVLTFVSKSFGDIKNLMLIEANDGVTWSIVYCFEPIDKGVRMEVLSIHPRVINEAQKSRKPISYFARTCLFNNQRTPQIGKAQPKLSL